jgi:hypothetical protein
MRGPLKGRCNDGVDQRQTVVDRSDSGHDTNIE